MAVQTVLQETITNFTCVGTTLIYQNEAGVISEFDLLDKLPDIRTVLSFNPTTKVLSYLDEGRETNTIDLSSLCSELTYNDDTHTIIHNGKPHQLNCGQFTFDRATCTLSYTNEKGNIDSYILPQDQFLLTDDGCGLVIMPAKGGSPITVPLGVPSSQVGLVLENKSLVFTYKEKKCVVPLPNSVIGCQYDLGTNTLRMLFCDGSTDEKALAKASLNCTTLPDGTQVFVFQDGCGGQKMFNIPGVVLDTDDVTLVGSTLTFTYGGDGNDNVVVVDICDIIGQNCNATITSIDQTTGAFTFKDNLGQIFSVPGHVPPKVVGAGDITVTTTVGPDGETIFTVNYEHEESTPHPTFEGTGDITVTPKVGDDGGTVYCIGYETPPDCCHYSLTSTDDLVDGEPTTIVGPPTDKVQGSTATQKHPNGLSQWECNGTGWVLKWTCIIPDPTTKAQIIAAFAEGDFTAGLTMLALSPEGNCIKVPFPSKVQNCNYKVEGALVPASPAALTQAQLLEIIDCPKVECNTATIRWWNVQAFLTCTDGQWVVDYAVQIRGQTFHDQVEGDIDFNDPPTAPAGPAGSLIGAVKARQNYLVECYDNGFCFWTCVNGAWALDMCHQTKFDSISGSVVDNEDRTARVTINGVACDLATLRLDTSDPCFHYWVDTKTNTVVSSRCVENVELEHQRYAFNPDLFADLEAAGVVGASGGEITTSAANANLPDTGWLTVGPYCITTTNPSQCQEITCEIGSRLGAYRMDGAAGAIIISLIGSGGFNSPTMFMDLGKVSNADLGERTCIVSENAPANGDVFKLAPGASRTSCITFRIRKHEDFVPTTAQSASFADPRAVALDTHKIWSVCTQRHLCPTEPN